jgi:peptide deformylase
LRRFLLSLLPIYTFDQPVLRKKAKPVRKTSEELVRFVEDMFDTMHNANGIGLAANQVGSLNRVIVIDVSEVEETKGLQPLVLLNAEVIGGEGGVVMEEGCLSIPEIKEEVERPDSVRVRYMDLDLQEHVLEATGLLARVVQHEIDHLNGVLFIDHLSALKRKMLRGRLNKIRRGEVEVSYPVVGGSSEEREYRKVNAR